jgi:hypothetical protein
VLVITTLLILALVLSACGKDKKAESTTPESAAAQEVATEAPAAAPTDTPAPTPTFTPPAPEPTDTPESAEAGQAPAETAGPSYASPEEVLDSYRTKGLLKNSIVYPDGRTEVSATEMSGAFVKTDGPYGSDQLFDFKSAMNDTTEESFTIYEVGDNLYLNTQGEWITVGRDQESMYNMLADVFVTTLQEIGFYIGEAKDAKDETINGIDAIHYSIDDPIAFARLADINPEQDGELQSVQVDVWVAKDGNFVVKYLLEAKITNAPATDDQGNEVKTDQEVRWEFELYDINADIEIVLPEDAPEPGTINVPGFEPGEFPLPPETEVGTSFFGTVELTSDLSEDDFVAFYKKTLGDLGWSVEGAMGFWTFTKDDTSFSMMLSTDEQTGKTTATFLPNE